MNLDLDRVPTSLDQALELLDTALTDREKGAWINMTAAKMFDLQAHLAGILRHEWSLDDDNTPLRIFFRELGLDDAKETSLLLIDAYWRRYNNEAIPLQELVREYLEE
jgi:hypothetical protein